MPQIAISQFDRKYPLPIETNRQFLTITLRNALPIDVRWEGMIVYCKDTQLSYQLKGGLNNTFWENLGDLVNVAVIDDLDSTSPTDALSANQGRVLKALIDGLPLDVNWGDIGGTLSAQTDLQSALNGKEPTFSKNTGFNKNFGTTAGTVSEGNHTHTFASLTAKPTTIAGYGITDYNSLGDARWLKRTTDTLTGDLTVTGLGTFGGSVTGTGGTAFKAVGSSSGTSNTTVYGLYESNGSTLQGYLGFPSSGSSDMFLYNGVGANYLRLMASGGADGLFYNWSGGSGKVWHAGNDGSGSGLDADVLRGVHWGNVNVDIISSGKITAAAYKTTNWEIIETSGVLQFKYSGVIKFEFNSSGIADAASDWKLGL